MPPSKNQPATPSDNPVTISGDIWLMGRHKLMCGNPDDPPTVDKLTGDGPESMIADPPWPIADSIIASEVLGATCHAMVAEATDADAAIRRWQNFTCQQATHTPTGQSFNDRQAQT